MTGHECSTEAALEQFLSDFETGVYPKQHWTHQAHVVMAAAYLTKLSREDATQRIRTGIPAYNTAQGGENTDTAGYHESLTIFWIHIVARYLESLPEPMTRLDRVRSVAAEFGQQRGLHKDYWSFDVVNSVEARRNWVPPDRIPLR